MIGIIGGSGLEKFVDGDYTTLAGCSPYCKGKIGSTEIIFMSRHGVQHETSPTRIPYQNNIKLLKDLGCDCIISLSACGSLKGDLKPGQIVIPKQVVDWTKFRDSSYSTNSKPVHTSCADPFDEKLIEVILDVLPLKQAGTLVTIEGPRFSTRAESRMFRQLGFDLINMTTCPECFLAKELKIPYVVINMVTDFDSWKIQHKPVTFKEVQKVMQENAFKVKEALKIIVPEIDCKTTTVKKEVI